MPMTRTVSISVDAQGRIVIPLRMRKALGITGKGYLAAKIEKGKLILEPPETFWNDVTNMFDRVSPSLSKKLLADRRKEAKGE
jgi:bifunctional DNA-binding transcriptional regulator/antitoxin component of YhaV-PrlF toxin-antitoxin module